MRAVVPGLHNTKRVLEEGLVLSAFASILLVEVVGRGSDTLPPVIQCFGNDAQVWRVRALVRDEEDVGEAVLPEAARNIIHHHGEGFGAQADHA